MASFPHRSAFLLFAALALLVPGAGASVALAGHGVSIDGTLKYEAGFERFDYASDKARKGGTLTLHSLGAYDKMNPYTLKGEAPDGLDAFVFESLAVSSLDEPFAKYGLIARDIELAADRLSVTFTIDERARFSDGSPVTPEDVLFSLETLKGPEAHPFYQSYFRDITGGEVLDSHRVRFRFAAVNRELHLIACELPVFSKKFYTEHSFGKEGMTPPLGSGPYLVEQAAPGKPVIYRRNPDYWGEKHPCRRGMFNFDRIVIKYFQDQIVAMEAFKAGEFDFMYVNIAKQWVRDLVGERFASGAIVRETLPHRNNAGMQGFVFNLRRPLFQDRRVRIALNLAFDFEWANSKLFFDQYTRNDSYFANSPLAASGLPEGLELEYLEPFRKDLPSEVFLTPPAPFDTKGKEGLRGNLRQAKKLLEEAGWSVKGGKLVDKEGNPFTFEMILVSPSFERVMAGYAMNLEKLGITMEYRTIDQALYVDRIKRFDFDAVVNVFGQSQSPGNEQRTYWHSTSADTPGSRNLAGIKNEAVDALVDRIVYATTQEELTAACHALDRVLWYGYFLVPNWYIPYHRVVYHNRFARPEKLPLYYSAQDALMTWWLRK